MRNKISHLLSVLAVLAVASASYGQNAQISGIITDTSGAVVPGATITVTHVETGVERLSASNSQGQYVLPFLPLGKYKVTVELAGFKPSVRQGIVLSVDQQARLDFTLEVGDLNQIVDVSAEAPLLESESVTMGQVIGRKQIADLPLNGRNYLQLAKLAAGVVDPPNGDRAASGGSFVANGTRATLNNFILDGVDNNSRIVDIQNASNVVIQPSVDAIAEFSVQTHNFSAEYGYSAGGVVNAVIKSGTNAFHGTAFEFMRDERFDARDFFLPRKPDGSLDDKAPLSRHQFGGTLGGPLVDNKTFFFASWEETRETRGLVLTATVPTLAMRTGDFSEAGVRPIFDPGTGGSVRSQFPGNRIPTSRFDSVAAKLVALLPPPTSSALFNNFSTVKETDDRRDQFDVRLDHSFSDQSKLFIRGSFMKRDFMRPGPFDPPLIGNLTAQAFDTSRKSQEAKGLAIGETHVFSASAVNELRLGYNRIQDDLLPIVSDRIVEQFGINGVPDEPGVTGLPLMNITGFTAVGDGDFLPNFKNSETFQIADNFSFNKGRHSIKTGVNYRYIKSYSNVSGSARGTMTFNGAFTQSPASRATTGNSFADFLLGYAQSAQLQNPFEGTLHNHYAGAYAQDDWRVSSKLTLNLGVRYEVFTHPFEADNLQANFVLDQRKMIYPEDQAPSVVPAALLTAIPSGVGSRSLIKTDWNNVAPRIGLAYKVAAPTVIRMGFGIFYADHPFIGASNRLVSNPPFRRTANFATDNLNPNFILRNGFPSTSLSTSTFNPLGGLRSWDIDFPQAYTHHWNVGVQHELHGMVVDLSYTGTRGRNLPIQFDTNGPRPGPGTADSRRPIQGFGAINREAPLGESFYNAGNVRIERRFSGGFGFLVAYTYGKAIDTGGEALIGSDTAYRDPGLTVFPSLDVERALALQDVRHHLVVSYLWELPFGRGKRWSIDNSIVNGLFGNWQFGGITTVRTGTPFTPALSVNPAGANTGQARPNRLADGNLPQDEQTIQRWFDIAAFAAPTTPFTFGNAGKNILIGPGAVNFDASLLKRFPLRGGELQFRAEAFNLLNTPQFGLPNATVDLPQGGTIKSLSHNMREFQFGVKLAF
jgi:hypothetical protein